MYFYEVFVGTATFHGHEPLTYESVAPLSVGQVVAVPLRAKHVLAIVSAEVTKPAFPVKPISQAFTLPPLPTQSLQLLRWLHIYYPAPLGVTTQQFLPKSLSEKLIQKLPLLSVATLKKLELPPLTSEQKKVLQRMRQPGPYVLHGETGSGKTRVYLELAREVLARQKSALILVPEISLSPQLASVFKQSFPGQVLIMHSQLTDTERRTTWLQALTSNLPLVIVGARSALFAPVKQLGLIVIDESHETAYKQEQAPHYMAQRVAGQLAFLHSATVVLGSATPSVVDYYVAEAKRLPILRMEHLAQTTDLPASEITVVDLKDRTNFSRTAHLSDQLVQAMGQALQRGEQSLLFLNRRGTARAVICRSCGWQALCPNCDLPLTYHGDTHQMRCHICGYHQTAPGNCPVCGSTDIVFKSIGTKAVIDEVQRLFPQASVQRFDADNTKAEQFNQHYEAIKAGRVDVLVGTQTLAKGLDLPRLSVVGVIQADTSLYLPDYTANERTYQLLYQVVGRVGRGHLVGRAIIQTYEPTSPLLQAAVAKDWSHFYKRELDERKQFVFPPFCFLLKLTCRRASSKGAQTSAEMFADKLRNTGLKIRVVGPSPAFHEKISGKSQWQLVIKAKQRTELLQVIERLPSSWSYDIDPIDLL